MVGTEKPMENGNTGMFTACQVATEWWHGELNWESCPGKNWGGR